MQVLTWCELAGLTGTECWDSVDARREARNPYFGTGVAARRGGAEYSRISRNNSTLDSIPDNITILTKIQKKQLKKIIKNIMLFFFVIHLDKYFYFISHST